MLKDIKQYTVPRGHRLFPFVRSIFRVKGHYAEERILPACNADILFNLSEPIRVFVSPDDKAILDFKRVMVAGLQTRAVLVRPTGNVGILGVMLQADGSGAVFPLPHAELSDRALDAGLLFPDVGCIHERVRAESRFDQQCTILLDWLGARLALPARNDVVRAACRLLDVFPNGRSMDRVVQASSLSSRQLRRLFRQQVGVNPATYARLTRFRQSIGLMESGLSLTEIAHQLAYTDQAHFCRDFRTISGISPGAYRSHSGHSPGHVFQPRVEMSV